MRIHSLHPACPSLRAVVTAGAVLTFVSILTAPPLRGQSALQWHGCAQIRYAGSSTASGFSLRRGKLWLDGPVPELDHVTFKAQGIFRDQNQGAFVLQDLYAQYRAGDVALSVGQMVPDFSLERAQADYRIPLAERAGAVNAMVPGATTLGRDLGAQMSFDPNSHVVHLSAGLFNGTGANHAATGNGAFLATARATLAHRVAPGLAGTVGGSFEVRSADSMDVGVLLPTSASFSGRELRWGTEAQLVARAWALQGEYLEAHLRAAVSHGFYVLGTYALSGANEVAVSVEQLNTPPPNARATPWYIVGFDHLVSPSTSAASGGARLLDREDQAAPTTLMMDVRVRTVDSVTEYQVTLQFQVFVH